MMANRPMVWKTTSTPALVNGHRFLQRKCACGSASGLSGQCDECGKKKVLGMQTKKLAISEPGDRYEQEADRIAQQILTHPWSPTATPRQRLLSVPAQTIQQRGVDSSSGLDKVPPQVDAALSAPGRPLDAATRGYFEPRFGHDFGRVRVHVDHAAAEAMQAHAFTVGHRIVFGAHRYQPGTEEGRRLLAHELTHVVQQSQNAPPHAPHPGPSLQRRVNVDKAKDLIDNPTGKGLVQTNAETVEGYLRTLCSGGSVSVDKGSGAVSVKAGFCPTPLPPDFVGPPAPSPADTSKEPTGCNCLCDMVGSANDYTIVVDDKDWPHTLGRTVTTPSPNSPKLWGAATVSGKTTNIDPWLVLGHEFCGHAWLAEKGLPDENATRGEGGHQETVERENELRKEHGIEARGSFKDPYCGESFWQDKAGPGPVQWSSYLKKCEAWRKKKYGGKYKISDKIP
jgi:Domain of unknown function (DUF4157)